MSERMIQPKCWECGTILDYDGEPITRDLPKNLTILEQIRLLKEDYEKLLKPKDLTREWISVEDRLPFDYTTVLIRGGCARYCSETELWYSEMGNAYNREIQWEVTHWMPLPEPPK